MALGTFATKKEAERALHDTCIEQARGMWVDPRVGKVSFGEYASQWLEQRSTIRPHTRESYASHLKLHLLPTFGPVPVAEISSQSHRCRAVCREDDSQWSAGGSHVGEGVSAVAVDLGDRGGGRCDREEPLCDQERRCRAFTGTTGRVDRWVYTIGTAIEGAQDVGGTSNGRDPFRLTDMITSSRKTAGESSMASGSGRIMAG